jgi:hypothetical protein
MTSGIIISGILNSDFPITPEQLSKMETLSSNLGLASILTFSEQMNRTIEIEVYFVCPETVESDWFMEFSRKIATVTYLGEKYSLRLNGLINVSDGVLGHPVGEIDVMGATNTVQQARLDYDKYVLAGYRAVIDPLPRLELA